MARVTKQTFSKNQKLGINAGVNLGERNSCNELPYCDLFEETLLMQYYAGSSFASNYLLLSQVWFLVMLCSGFKQRHVLDYQSQKSRRVVRSALVSEVFAFTEPSDVDFQTSTDLKGTLGKYFDLFKSMDSMQLFNALTKGRRTDKNKQMIDILATLQLYKRIEITRSGFIRDVDNHANGLTKDKSNDILIEIFKIKVSTRSAER